MLSVLPGTRTALAGSDAAVHGACGMLCPATPSPVPGDGSVPSGRTRSGSSAAVLPRQGQATRPGQLPWLRKGLHLAVSLLSELPGKLQQQKEKNPQISLECQC